MLSEVYEVEVETTQDLWPGDNVHLFDEMMHIIEVVDGHTLLVAEGKTVWH